MGFPAQTGGQRVRAPPKTQQGQACGGQAGHRAHWPGGGSGPLSTLTTMLHSPRGTCPCMQPLPWPLLGPHGISHPSVTPRPVLGPGSQSLRRRNSWAEGSGILRADPQAPVGLRQRHLEAPVPEEAHPEGETLLLMLRLEGRSRQSTVKTEHGQKEEKNKEIFKRTLSSSPNNCEDQVSLFISSA